MRGAFPRLIGAGGQGGGWGGVGAGGGRPPGNFCLPRVVPKKHFYVCFCHYFQVSNLILKAKLAYLMQYFSSTSADTGTVAL